MGKIKSYVLYHKGGVVTEERFKNLTHLQWLYHYKEIRKYKDAEFEKDKTILEILIKKLEENAELSGLLTFEKVAKEYLDKKQSDKKPEISESEEEDFKEFMKTLKPLIAEIPDEDKYILPKYNKSQGIVKGVKSNDAR